MARNLPHPPAGYVRERTFDSRRGIPLTLLAIAPTFAALLIAPLVAFAQPTTTGSASSVRDTLRHFIASSRYHHVTIPNVVQQVERFAIAGPVSITAVSVTLAGRDAHGSCRLRFYGAEAGAPVPRWGSEIAPPVTINKSSYGAETIRCALSVPIPAVPPQFFIAVENLTPGTVLISDHVERAPECVAFEDTFGLQALKMRDGSWSRFPFAFDISVEFERANANDKPWFVALGGTPEAFDSVIGARSIAWADVDDDRFPELLVGGRLWKNMEGERFREIQIDNGGSTPLANLFLDADLDGDPDILLAGFPGGESGIIRYLENDDGEFKPARMFNAEIVSPAAFTVADLDNDSWPDVVIARGSDVGGLLYLRNQEGNGFVDATPRLPLEIAAMRCRGIRCIDGNDGRAPDLAVLDNVGRWHVWSHPLEAESTGSVLIGFEDLPSGGRVYAGDWVDLNNDSNPEILLGVSASRSMGRRRHMSVAAGSSNQAETNTGGVVSLGPFVERRGGIAAADIDNDDRPEILLLTTRSCHPAALIRLDSTGHWEDLTWRAGLVGRAIGPDAVWVDIDNDGRIDLSTFENGRILLLKNQIDIPPGRRMIVRSATYGLRYDGPDGDHLPALALRSAAGRGHLMQGPPTFLLPENADSASSSVDRGRRVATDRSRARQNLAGDDAKERVDVKSATLVVVPNPFSGVATIRLDLTRPMRGRLTITTIDGLALTTLADGAFDVGSGEWTWDPGESSRRGLSGGTFLVVFQGEGERLVERVVYVK